jgi:hypothetical protein
VIFMDARLEIGGPELAVEIQADEDLSVGTMVIDDVDDLDETGRRGHGGSQSVPEGRWAGLPSPAAGAEGVGETGGPSASPRGPWGLGAAGYERRAASLAKLCRMATAE